MTLPLMPKATAVWLIEKTALTFTQIADFCGMHPLEVQAIADGEVAQGIVGYDPVANGQVTRRRDPPCEADPDATAEADADRPADAEAAARLALHAGGQAQRPAGRHRLPAAQLPAADRGAGIASCSAPPRTPSRRCASGATGTAPTSSRAIR